MHEAESIKSNPKNEYIEEENRLLSLNIKELASLNDNVHEMSVNLEKSLTLRFYYAAIAVWQQDPQQFVQIDRLFTLFYYKFIEPNNTKDERWWSNNIDSRSVLSWMGLSFELVCLSHHKQIKSH